MINVVQILAEPFEHQLERVKQYVPFDAYLFGSRSKISVGPDSDWDFAAKWSGNNHDKLIAAGYQCLGIRQGYTWMAQEPSAYKEQFQYCDQLSVAFYVKEVEGLSINVVLKNDMELFKKVWERISEQFFVDFIWKQGPFFVSKGHITQVMDQLFEVAR